MCRIDCPNNEQTVGGVCSILEQLHEIAAHSESPAACIHHVTSAGSVKRLNQKSKNLIYVNETPQCF